MNNILMLWPMIAAVSLTLSGVHLFIWIRDQHLRSNLYFSMAALSLALFAGFELAMMQATSVADFIRMHRGWHLAGFFLIFFLIIFVGSYLRSGRRGLALLVIGLRLLILAIMFSSDGTFNFKEIRGLLTYDFFGVDVAVPDGVPRPLARLGDLSLLLFLGYVVDAAVQGWRRGEPRERSRALVVGGGVALLVGVSMVNLYLVHTVRIHAPYFVSIVFMFVVFAMGYELSIDLIHANRLARELRQSEARLNLAANAASMGLWSLNLKTNQFWLTPKTREILKFEPDKAVFLDTFLAKVHPDDTPVVRQAIEDLVQKGGERHVQYRICHPDGRIAWMYSRGRMQKDQDETMPSMMGVTMDVTSAKQADLEAERNRNEIAHLSRAVLLGELSGAIAHELNQPLTAILSNAQAAQRFLAAEEVDMEEVRAILADIVADDRRAGEVIRRLRLLLKKGQPQRQWLDVHEVVEDALKLTRSELLNNHISLTTELDANPSGIVADRVHVQQILLNLISNACEVMAGTDPDHRHLTIRTSLSDAGEVIISVIDTGGGLSREAEAHMFDPFFTTKTTGLGLGLKVCQTLVTAHGGCLTGENNARGGATFRVTFPAVPETAKGVS